MNEFRSGFWPDEPRSVRAVTGAGARAGVLQSYGIDALVDDPELTAIAGFAARLCGTQAAIVNLVESERQRFLGREGLTLLEAEATPASCCVHTMYGGAPMEVADARLDPRFADNPFVSGPPFLRFYAGFPLIAPEGVPLGALCVIDSQPRSEGLTELQREGMTVLAQAVLRRLRARRDELATAEELERRDLHLRAVADSIPAIAWSADGDGNFDYFNRQLVEFTGNASHETGGAIHPDDFPAANAHWQHCLRTGETYEFEHRVRRHDGEYRWMMARTVPFMGPDGRPVRWFGTAVDVHDAHVLSESRDLLAKELSHRIKNIFAVVAGLVSLAIRRKPEAREFGTELIGTIRALGRAHDYVRPAGGDRRDSLHGMLEDLFLPYGTGDGARVIVKGDDAAIAERAATPLALVFHELATNSAKYGALANDRGTIDLSIADRGDTLLLHWVEHGGTMPEGEPTRGFGTHLIETSLTGQLGGSWDRRFEPGGMVCEMTVAKAAIAP